jgi:hypothetical protein
VLTQGVAAVDLNPSRDRLEAMVPQAERYIGKVVRGRLWDHLLREYYFKRVFVDITVERVVSWADLSASGEPQLSGRSWRGAADEQEPPKNGSGPRVDMDRVAAQIAVLPHRVLAYRGADGFPVVVPIEIGGHDGTGLRLVVPDGLLPQGGRRAGVVAHAYRPQLVGLGIRTFTGWLDVGADGTTVYAPHTSKGFVAPPRKKLLLVSNGLFAKYGLWQARRRGTADRLERAGCGEGPVHGPQVATSQPPQVRVRRTRYDKTLSAPERGARGYPSIAYVSVTALVVETLPASMGTLEDIFIGSAAV